MVRRPTDTVFSAYVAAPPVARPASTSSLTRINRHRNRARANGPHGTVRSLDVAHAVRSLATAPVVVPATVGGLAAAVAVSLAGTAALVAVPVPVLAALVWAAYGLGRARGTDEATTAAALEAGPGARLALEAAQDGPDGPHTAGGAR